MNTINLIHAAANTQPEGTEILKMIKVDMNNIQNQYHNCDLLRAVVGVKFDADKLSKTGYSLQEILDMSQAGVIVDEIHKFVLTKLQEFIRARQKLADTNKATA